MPLETGKTLLHYRMVEKIGEGGMGMVWKAVDIALDREVAIKVLPEAFAMDVDRLARFEREAKLLASLNHPHIAAIYGLHQDDGVHFLAMELILGEDLSQRLARGPLPIGEALGVARQIAGALETAHESGVIHRDLKPANIKLTVDHRVKVLDFGLAKVASPLAGPDGTDPELSPTVTSGGTRAGVILGTAGYMSPEQARGRAVDRRADLWAFGCVLYEMLVGESLFRGETVSDRFAAVLDASVDLNSLPPRTPAGVRRLLRRCIERDLGKRLQSAGDARIELEEAIVDPDGQAEIGPGRVSPHRFSWSLAAAAFALAIVAAGLAWTLKSSAEEAPLRRFELNVRNIETRSGSPLISPDGLRIAYAADGRLWIRRLDRFQAIELPDSKGGETFFWSPDSSHLAYEAHRKLWRVASEGGRSAVICDLPWNRGVIGGAWGADDRILLSSWRGDMYEVSARGGEAKPFIRLDPTREIDFHWLDFLPDGRSIVVDVHRIDEVGAIEAVSGDRRVVVFEFPEREDAFGERGPLEGQGADQRTSAPAYSPTGHLLYRRFDGNQGLWAMPFSASRLEITGEPFLVAADGRFPTVSRDGTLVYLSGSVYPWTELVWVGRGGAIVETVGEAQEALHYPQLSPDGNRVAYVAIEDGNQDIFVLDLESKTPLRLTFSESEETGPAWMRGGERVIFHVPQQPNPVMFIKNVHDIGATRRLGEGRNVSVSLDGSTVVYQRFDAQTLGDLWSVSVPEKAATVDVGKSIPAVQSDAYENYPAVSPDGRYIAYAAEDSGRQEIFVHRLGDNNTKWQVSNEGSDQVRWSPGGNELFYVTAEHVVAVPVRTEPTFAMGPPQELFSWKEAGLFLDSGFDTDGKRFLMVRDVGRTDTGGPSIRIVQNWYREFE